MSRRHVYVVDDEEPIRRAVHLMLRVMGFHPAAFESGGAFLAAADGFAPGCVLLDMRMPELDGIEVLQRLHGVGASHEVIVMSGHGDLAAAVPAMENGAVAFLEKPFERDALREALEIAFLKIEDAAAFTRYGQEARDAVAGLGATEQAVLAGIAEGKPSQGIAGELGLTVAQVDLCVTRIFAELKIRSTNDALRIAFAARS